MYERPHTKMPHFLKVWYKCRILPPWRQDWIYWFCYGFSI